MSKGRHVSVAVLDLRAMVGFFSSVAFAVELQRGTHIRWQDYKDSQVLNIVYALMPWKGEPGWVEVDQDIAAIKRSANFRAAQLFGTFLHELETRGPKGAGLYADRMADVRDSALQSVHQLFREANQINAEVTDKTGEAIRTLAVIRLGSSLLVSGAGCYVALGLALPA